MSTDLDTWRARLEEADPGLLGEIARLQALLSEHVADMVPLLERVWGLSWRWNAAFYAHASRTDPAVDAVRDRLDDAIGTVALHDLADRLRDAHPEEHVLTPEEQVVFEAERALLLEGWGDGDWK